MAAVIAETSSAAAGTTPVIANAAIELAAVSSEPIACSWPAAANSSWGCVVRNDIWSSPLQCRNPARVVVLADTMS
ncbi:hypothetical protein A9X05_16210 [Mycobacterium sp. E3298]|nr:hypothetical protein A5704_24810 [Mycobacterium sp. E735]OBG86064.1 hypothetical protein A9X05_16210 [Mycobacterium sp. E3298]